mmetsp:Transcript_27743/g.93224  ORF Transcript_27743/g.93224 Transcript_27743/m.93224 type:complete len:239 (+) Transcript_27743:74-790(+)
MMTNSASATVISKGRSSVGKPIFAAAPKPRFDSHALTDVLGDGTHARSCIAPASAASCFIFCKSRSPTQRPLYLWRTARNRSVALQPSTVPRFFCRNDSLLESEKQATPRMAPLVSTPRPLAASTVTQRKVSFLSMSWTTSPTSISPRRKPSGRPSSSSAYAWRRMNSISFDVAASASQPSGMAALLPAPTPTKASDCAITLISSSRACRASDASGTPATAPGRESTAETSSCSTSGP